MSENPDGLFDSPPGAVDASSETAHARDLGTYKVHFGEYWSGSKARNSFELSRAGEIDISGDLLVVRAFRREMLMMGSRIEFKFARAYIADVSQLANFVSLHIVRPNQDLETLGFWAQDEADAKKIVQALPSTVSAAGSAATAAGIAVNQYQAQLKALERGD